MPKRLQTRVQKLTGDKSSKTFLAPNRESTNDAKLERVSRLWDATLSIWGYGKVGNVNVLAATVVAEHQVQNDGGHQKLSLRRNPK